MIIEDIQEVIRSVLVDFDVYDECDEDLINVLSERICVKLKYLDE